MPGGGLYTPTEFVVYSGITDADGNATKTTLKCSAIGSASAYPDFDGNQIIITSGDYKGQARDIDGATNGDAAGTITVANAFDGKILEDTLFLIMGIRTVPAEVAALEGKVGAGYDGLDDNKELGSSVRGHLFAGLIHGTGTMIPDNKSLYDILGIGYIHDAGDFTHSIRRHLRRGVAGANATDVLAEADSLYGKIRGTPASGVIDNLNVNTEVDLITEVTQTTVAEIDAFYVDYTGWLLDGAIAGNAPTLTIRVYLDDDGGTLREVGNLRDVITESISVGKMVKIEGLGTFERNFKVTVQSSLAPNGGAASDLVKYHYTKYDKE